MLGHEVDPARCARRRGLLRYAEAEKLSRGSRICGEVVARREGNAEQAQGGEGRHDCRGVAQISRQDQPLGKQMGSVDLGR